MILLNSKSCVPLHFNDPGLRSSQNKKRIKKKRARIFFFVFFFFIKIHSEATGHIIHSNIAVFYRLHPVTTWRSQTQLQYKPITLINIIKKKVSVSRTQLITDKTPFWSRLQPHHPVHPKD